MATLIQERLVSLDVSQPIWEQFFTVAPLVVIGTREGDGYDLAPKHMALPIGWQNYFGFVCTPHHATYHNAKHHSQFTVSFPRPEQIVLTSLSAAPRCDRAGQKPAMQALPTFAAELIDGVLLRDAYLFLECELDRVIDGFGSNSLIIGRIVAAHVHEEALRASEVDDQEVLLKAPLLSYVSPGRYAVIDQSFSFPLPVGFQH